jgi:uncharacterized membrane protein
MAGRRRRSSSYEEFVEERRELSARAGGGPDWAARLVAFKGVFLEGLEVGLIVLALGGAPGQLTPALLGAAVALFTAEGLGVDWPLGDLALIYLATGLALFALSSIARQRRPVAATR